MINSNKSSSQFSIKCECIVIKNNIQINAKKKSKFSLVTLKLEAKVLTIAPFDNKNQEPIAFEIGKLKAILKKYIEEGKITIQFIDRTEKLQLKGVDVTALNQKVEVISTVLISSASKQNLELLITKIIAIKKNEPAQKIVKKEEEVKLSKKRVEEINNDERQKLISRKEARKQLANPSVSQPLNKLKNAEKAKVSINLLDLPTSLLDNIFEYCQFYLGLRCVSKQFSSYILKNIISIKLRDEVDEQTFNKLCRWAINIECRMKNVKNIILMDRYQQQQLLVNKAKSLRFGNWKEMSVKNCGQLKGLRIYLLEIPYQIKFDLSFLFGIRMVELRLKSNSFVTLRNQFIKTEDICHILRNIKELRVLEIPYVNTDLLTNIEFPLRLEQLSIAHLSDFAKEGTPWWDLKKFQNLKVLEIWCFSRGGVKKDNHQINLQFPQKLEHLSIGSFISNTSLQVLPFSITSLSLIGDNFYNRDLADIVLPNLRLLNITMSKHIRSQALQNCSDLLVQTSWDRQTVKSLQQYMSYRNITITTNK